VTELDVFDDLTPLQSAKVDVLLLATLGILSLRDTRGAIDDSLDRRAVHPE